MGEKKIRKEEVEGEKIGKLSGCRVQRRAAENPEGSRLKDVPKTSSISAGLIGSVKGNGQVTVLMGTITVNGEAVLPWS